MELMYEDPLYLADFYKVGHVFQYPKGTKQVWANWTARSTRVPGTERVVFFGMQYFIKRYLQGLWQEHFFDKPLEKVISQYKDFIKSTLGTDIDTTHIQFLHKLGYLPIDIYAIPEGYSVDLRVPSLVITNTVPEAYWLPNFLETILSNILWKPCTSATTAQRFRGIFTKYAIQSGEKDLGFIDWQGHDFSFRGMGGVEDAILSGMAHLLSFSGTDTMPAILAAKQFYGADFNCGGSVPATEHSVMCAGGQDGELETFRRLITEVYPSGVVSIVSDTWDLWKVLTEYVSTLKEQILARDGKVVIRPDSGDPVKIICGDADLLKVYPFNCNPGLGVLRILAKVMGVDNKREGLPLINKMGAIYGDSINLERADQILNRTVNELKLSPYNVVFGIGSYTYEYCTRDTHGFAMKATAVRMADDKVTDIFKKPITDDGIKNSLKGIPAVYRTIDSTEDKPRYLVVEGAKPEQLDNCAFQKVFSDGNLLIDEKFETIRKRVRA